MAWSTPSALSTGTLVTAATWNQDVKDNSIALRAGALTGLVVSGTGPHAIGGSTVDYVRLGLTGAFTSGGSSNVAFGTYTSGVLTGHSGDSAAIAGVKLNNTIVTAGNCTTIAQVWVSEPQITVGAGSVTNSASVYIEGAASEGTNNFSLWVDSGAVKIDSSLAIGTSSVAAGASALAVGSTAAASGSNAYALGYSALASGDYSYAFGYDQTVSGEHSLGLGYRGTVSGNHSVLITLQASDAGDLSTENTLAIMGGNCGIGTLLPVSLLDVRGPTGTGAAPAGVLTLATDELTIVDGDQLGRLEFRSPIATAGTDAIVSAASIWAEANATFSASVNSADIVFATAASGAATEKMRILSSGNVGINQSAPTHKLHVIGDIKLQNSQIHLSDGYGLLWGNNGINGSDDTDSMRFDTAGGARLTIDSAGLVTAGNDFSVVGFTQVGTTSASTGINSPKSTYFNIDSDNDATSEVFIWGANRATTSGGTELMRLDEAGQLGINTTGATHKLHVVGDIKLQSSQIHLSDGYGLLWDDNGLNGNAATNSLRFDTGGVQRLTINSAGLVNVDGTFTAGTKTFRIKHPLPEKSENFSLVHACLEGPRLDLLYRGVATLVEGVATVDLDEASGMTAGTWVLLCRDPMAMVINATGFASVRGSVSGSTLTITCEESNCSDIVSWLVVAERQDEAIKGQSSTDDDGRLILEPLKVPPDPGEDDNEPA
jgi:hypothetical protein